MARKRCSRCKQSKPLSEFAPSKRAKGGAYCRDCANEYGREQRRTPESKAWYYRRHLKLKFGISDEEARRLAAITACECCGAEPGERLHIDHDHETGEIRGALCRRCNFALAVLDDLELCRALDAYIHSAQRRRPALTVIEGGAA